MTDRILLLIKGLGRGGAEQILASSVPHLDRERFDYEVAYLLPWKDALAKEIADQGIPVHCLNGGPGSLAGSPGSARWYANVAST